MKILFAIKPFFYIIIIMNTQVEKIGRLSYYSDTPADVENFQVDLLKKAGAAKRFKITLSLSQRMIALSRQALRRTHQGLSDMELKILFVKNCYGPEMAERVKKYMIKKKTDANR